MIQLSREEAFTACRSLLRLKDGSVEGLFPKESSLLVKLNMFLELEQTPQLENKNELSTGNS